MAFASRAHPLSIHPCWCTFVMNATMAAWQAAASFAVIPALPMPIIVANAINSNDAMKAVPNLSISVRPRPTCFTNAKSMALKSGDIATGAEAAQ
jgi:hypothetical protein